MKELRNEKILVTGPAGQIAFPLTVKLAQNNEVWGLARFGDPSTRDKVEAQRIAAIINHQGPQIPARVIENNGDFRVIAGPFNDGGQAREATKRLKIDLEIDGIVIDVAKVEETRTERR